MAVPHWETVDVVVVVEQNLPHPQRGILGVHFYAPNQVRVYDEPSMNQ